MATDQEIAEGLEALFRETNPNSYSSINEVVLHLQSKLGFDLSHKFDFIRSRIALLFPPQAPQLPPQQQQQQAPVTVVSRPLPSPVQPNPNLNVSHHPNLNVAHHPNVSHHPKVAYHPNSAHLQGRQHVFHSFPGVPTEISFAQPGGTTDVSDTISSPTAKDSTQKPKRRGGPGGLNKLCGVTPQLQAIVGQPEMPRTEIVKQLWAYIRKHNLQDPSNKRKIICNDELRLLFEVDCTDMFQMNKLLAKHIVALDSTKDSGQQSKKLKVEESEVVKSEPVPIVISEALANFFGTSEKEMLQSDVYKRIEEYIKAEGLEDPSNAVVACDTKLQELLGCQTITASEVREALARNHLFQKA